MCEQLAAGVPLVKVCKEQGMPSLRSVYAWMDEDAAIAAQVARAREDGEDAIATDCLDIADDKDDHPASRKVRVWTRLELLKRWNPKKWGERIQHADADGNNLPPVQFLMQPVTSK